MDMEQLESDDERINSDERDSDKDGEARVAVEMLESRQHYSEVLTVVEDVLCYPDTKDETPMVEMKLLECDDKLVKQQEEDQSNGETNETTPTTAEVIEENLHGPAMEEALVDTLCFGDAAPEAPTLKFEQLDFNDKAGETDEKNDGDLGEMQQAVESSEQESQGPVDVEESLTVLCFAHSIMIDSLPEPNDVVDQATTPLDTRPFVSEERTAEGVTEHDQNLKAEESRETIFCYANDTETATILDLDTLDDVAVAEGQISNDIEGEQLASEEREKRQASKTTTSDVHSPAIQVPTANVLCFAGLEMMAPVEMEMEALESDARSEELSPVRNDSGMAHSVTADQDAFILAESIVGQVMSKANGVLECRAELDADQANESEIVRETSDSGEEEPKEAVTVIQFWSQSEDEVTDGGAPGETRGVAARVDDTAEKTPSGVDEQKTSMDYEAAGLSQDLLSQVVNTASEVHITQHPRELEFEEKGSLSPDITDSPDKLTSEETAEPAAIRRSSYLCGSEQSASEVGEGHVETRDVIPSIYITHHIDEVDGEGFTEVAPADIGVVEHSNTIELKRDVEGSDTEEVYPVKSTNVLPEDTDEVGNIADRNINVEIADAEAEVHSVEVIEIASAGIDVDEHISTIASTGDVEVSEAAKGIHPDEVVDEVPEEINGIEQSSTIDPSVDIESSETETCVHSVEEVGLIVEDIDGVENSSIIQSDKEVEVSEAEPEVRADEVVPAIAEASEDIMSEKKVVESANEVHASDILVPLKMEESSQALCRTDSSNATAADDGTEPASVKRSEFQCGSQQGDGEATWVTDCEHDQDATCSRSDCAPAPTEDAIKITIDDAAICTRSSGLPIGTVLSGAQTCAPTIDETPDVDSAAPKTGNGERKPDERQEQSAQEEGAGSDEPPHDISTVEGNDDAETKAETSERNCSMDIMNYVEAGPSNAIVQRTVEFSEETARSTPGNKIESNAYSMKAVQHESKVFASDDESGAGPGKAEEPGISSNEGVSVLEVERTELIGGKDMSENSIVTEHSIVTEKEASMLHELLSESAKAAVNDGDRRSPEPLCHDLLGLHLPANAGTVERCLLAEAADNEESQGTDQRSTDAAGEPFIPNISYNVEENWREGNESPAGVVQGVAQEGSSLYLPLQSATAATSDDLQRHLLDEVDEQTTSFDTTESFEVEGRDDPDEIFYSFDTEDETMLDGMKGTRTLSRDATSLSDSVDFTEVAITVTDSQIPQTHSESEDDSDDSSCDTPRILVGGQSSSCRPSDPDPENLQKTSCGTDHAGKRQTNTEVNVITTQSESSTVKNETVQSGQCQDPQRNKNNDDPHVADEVSSSTVPSIQERHHTQETSRTSSSSDQPSDPCDAVCKEEAPLTSFSDVSQVKPLVLSRAKSLSMSDESEADDWDPPSAPARRQPLLKLDIRPRTSLGELDGALSPREAVPQPPVSRPLRSITPTLTDIAETEGDLREEPLRVAATLGHLARYSHNFGSDSDDELAAEKTSRRPPTPPSSPNPDRKVQMWQQFVELQHAADEEPSSPPQPLSTSDIMYLYIESATGTTSTSELSEIGLSAAVPRHEHRASAVRLERTVSADCVRRRRRVGLARCSSADGLLQRGRPPMDIANIIALGRLPLSSPEPRDDAEAEERDRGKKCVSWSDLHGSGELEVIHGSPDRELLQPPESRSDSEASSGGEESDDEPDLAVGGSLLQQPPADFGLTMPDEVRRRARRYLPQHTRPAHLEIANWDLIEQDVGIPLVEQEYTKRVANAATQTMRDASSQTDYIEEMISPPEHIHHASSSDYQTMHHSSERYEHPYSSFSNYNAYPTSRAYDARNSFNNPGLRSEPRTYNFHSSSSYDSSRYQHPPQISSDAQRYSFEYTHHHVYPDQSTAPLNTSGSRSDSLERQICRELASLRQERERSRVHWDSDMERHRRLLQVESSLQKSLQQMRALVMRRRERTRVLMETLPPFQPGSRHDRTNAALPAYRQTTVVPSAGLDARLADIGGSYDKANYEYDTGGLDYTSRLREAPSVTHVLHQEIHVPPCCNHAPPAARPAPAARSPRRMTPSQYRQHLAAIRRRILAHPRGSAVQPPPLTSSTAPSRSRRVDPWSTAEPARPGHSALTRSEPDLSRAAGVWRTDVPPTVTGSTGDLGDRRCDTEAGFMPTETGRTRYGLY